MHQDRRDRAAALVQARLDHQALGRRVHRRLQLQHLGLQQHLLEQRVDALARLGRHRHEGRLAAVFLRHHALADQLLPDFFRIGLVLVDLVDRHHDRHLGRLGVVDRLDGLRHHAVVGGHDQHHQVGDLGAARAHGREGFVARRVQKRHHAARRLHVVGADVLGDAARLARGDAGAADVIQQRSLAVIDVAHHGHHGRARLVLRLMVLHGRFLEEGLGIVELGRLGDVAHFLDHDHRGFLVEHLVDRHHAAQLHQHLDDFGRLDRHLVGQIAHRDGLGHRDLAHHRFGRRGERVVGGSVGGCRAAFVAPALWRVPSGGALDVAARLDGAALDALVLPDFDFLRLLRGFLVGPRGDLGLVQRGRAGWRGGRQRLRAAGVLPLAASGRRWRRQSPARAASRLSRLPASHRYRAARRSAFPHLAMLFSANSAAGVRQQRRHACAGLASWRQQQLRLNRRASSTTR